MSAPDTQLTTSTLSPSRSEPIAPAAWRQLAALSVVVLLALSPWFSAAAVAPAVRLEWDLDLLGASALTIAVQLGFVVGALALAMTGAADVVSARWLIFGGASVAALANLGFALIPGSLAEALPYRAATGLGIAWVYPVGMKVLAGWFGAQRGLAVGIMIGALTVGSALPHLFRALGTLGGVEWRSVVLATSVAALLAGLLALSAIREGPMTVRGERFNLSHARRAFQEPGVRLVNFGYLGHMWELYAMWTWIPAFFVASLAVSGNTDPRFASLAAFGIVGAGGIGCVIAGALADRLGRTTVTMTAMGFSGTSAVLIGFLFGAPAWMTIALGVFWGITVVADSAQFSTAASELAPRGTGGSALALQTAGGFLLTGVSITLIGLLSPTDATGWRMAFGLLAVGPALGIVAMWRLRRRPESILMASGNR